MAVETSTTRGSGPLEKAATATDITEKTGGVMKSIEKGSLKNAVPQDRLQKHCLYSTIQANR